MQDIRWAIDEMYPEQKKVYEAIELLKSRAEEMEELSKEPKKNLKEILKLMKTALEDGEDILVYAKMKQDEDSKVSQSQKQATEAMQSYMKFVAALSFLRPYLLGLSKDEQKELLEDAELEEYKNYLNKIFRFSEHTLTQKEEYLLSKLNFLGNAPQDIYYFLTNADLKFPKLDSTEDGKLTAQNFTTLQQNRDVNIRKESFEKFYNTYKSFGNTISTSYFNNIKALSTEAELRNYDSARQMELFNDDVDVKVYDALLESIHNNMSYMHRYYAKKKEMLGLEEQHMYDVYLPIEVGESKEYTFEEAKELCIASVAVLGEEYQNIYRSAFETNWVDVYPREGKRGGAYSSGSYKSKPYILMNFNGTLDSVFTLAHEMGHSLHTYFAKSNNKFLDYNYTIFVAEVASTFNELLLLNYLVKRAETKKEKLLLLNHHLDSFKSTVYRQTMFAEFEKIVHERVDNGEALTQLDFDEIYLNLNKEYFGDAMVSDPLIAHEWMRIPHFYNNFYVYKYATGFSAATVLSQKVLNGEEGALDNYFKFLKDGCKHYPIEQLKMAGCDLSDPKTIDGALKVFGKLVDELEKY